MGTFDLFFPITLSRTIFFFVVSTICQKTTALTLMHVYANLHLSIFNLQYDRQHVVKLLLHQLKAILDFAVKAYICNVPALSWNMTVV